MKRMTLLIHAGAGGVEKRFNDVKATFDGEFISVSEQFSRVIFSLVLTMQCLVFVVGIVVLAASVCRSAFFLLSAAQLPPPTATWAVFIADVTQSHSRAQSVHTAPAVNGQRLTEDHREDRQASLFTSDIMSLAALQLFSETKV